MFYERCAYLTAGGWALQERLLDDKISKTYVMRGRIHESKSTALLCRRGRAPELHQGGGAILHLPDSGDAADPSAGRDAWLRAVRPQHPPGEPDERGAILPFGREGDLRAHEQRAGARARRGDGTDRHLAGRLCARIRAQRPFRTHASLPPEKRQRADLVLSLLDRRAGCGASASGV